jgi:U3 small nucleolar RNA-associated protein 7
MESLFAKAKASDVKKPKRYPKASSSKSKAETETDRTSSSIAHRTTLPKSLQDSEAVGEHKSDYGHIANKKLRATLNRQSAQTARAKALVEDAELLRQEDAGLMQVEDEMEKTWRVTQSEVVDGAGSEAGKGRREWRLDGGPYQCRYTRNGRCVASSTHMNKLIKADIQASCDSRKNWSCCDI